MKLLVTRDYPEEVLAPLREAYEIERGEASAQALGAYDAIFTTIGDAWPEGAFEGAARSGAAGGGGGDEHARRDDGAHG